MKEVRDLNDLTILGTARRALGFRDEASELRVEETGCTVEGVQGLGCGVEVWEICVEHSSVRRCRQIFTLPNHTFRVEGSRSCAFLHEN